MTLMMTLQWFVKVSTHSSRVVNIVGIFEIYILKPPKPEKIKIGFMLSCTAIASHNAKSLNSKILSTTTLIKDHPNNVR